MNIIVQVVFSGLIMLASDQPHVGKNAALLVEDEHYASVFLRRGSVVQGSCVQAKYSEACLLWDLEPGSPWEVYFPQIQQESSRRIVGRSEHNGKPVVVPKVSDDVADTDWMPSLSKFAGPHGLDDGCKEGVGQGCGGGLAARFVIPRGRIKTCHLAHLPERDAKVLLAYFPQSSVAPRAIANAFINTWELPADSLTLCRKRSSEEQCVTIEPDAEGIVRLHVRNERGNPRCTKAKDEAADGPHSHFVHFYPMLAVATTGPIPVLDDQLVMDGYAGECENDLSEADSIDQRQGAFVKQLQIVWNNLQTGVGQDAVSVPVSTGNVTAADLVYYCARSWPHSTSQCDNSTYP